MLFSENVFASNLTLGFSLKIKTYNAPEDVKFLTSFLVGTNYFPVCIMVENSPVLSSFNTPAYPRLPVNLKIVFISEVTELLKLAVYE
jgi:hypothetical protein